MKRTDQKGFSAVEVLIILVIVAVIAGIGWFVWQKQKDADTKSSQTTQKSSSNTSSSNSQSKLPAGYTTYTNSEHKFSFAYPKEWGEAKHSDTSNLSHYTAVTPEVGSIFIGRAQLTGRMTISNTSKEDFSITTAKYGATVKPSGTNGTYSWQITEVNPADTTDIAGTAYTPTSFKNTKGTTVYDFQWQDEGATHAVWVFAAHDEFITLRPPSVYTTDEFGYTETSVEDLASYQTLAKKVADTIEVD